MQSHWQPFLKGPLADQAWQAIDAIARDIPAPSASRHTSPSQWALAGGASGIAVFYAYLARATGEEKYADLACDHLQSALDGASGQLHSLGLWDGLLGVSWAFDHLAQRLFDVDEDDVDEDVSDGDQVLATLLRGPLFHNYELVGGLAGFGVACLEGLPRPGARRALDAVLDHLVKTHRTLADGVVWHTPPSLLPDWQRELAPEGYYNLGVAHGMPAVMLLLARCAQEAIRLDDVLPLLDGLVRWLLAQRGEQGFANWRIEGKTAAPGTRLAWCYGDPGIAASLMTAGTVTGRPSWCAAAEDIAVAAASRDPAQAGVRDAGICHGSAGVAHLFHRLYRACGRAELADAARFWFQRTLEMRRADRGVGGFSAWSIPRGQGSTGELGWVDDPGMLTGAAGVGLCLLGAVSGLEPSWDACLMASAPPARRMMLAA